MRYSNAINEEEQSNEYHPFTYVHPDGQETKYDLQELENGNQLPVYVLSESRDNQGPGFDDPQTRDEIAHLAAQSAIALNNPEIFPESTEELSPNRLVMFQQKPDGDFDRVSFYEIGKDGRSNVDIEISQNDPELRDEFVREDISSRPTEFTEAGRETYTRDEVEEIVDGAPLHAPEQTLQQQRQDTLQREWEELSGPSIDNETKIQVQQEQAQEQQQQQQY